MHARAEMRGGAATLCGDGHVHDFAPRLVAGLEAERDRLAHVAERFVARSALRDASRQGGALGDDPAVFARTQDDGDALLTLGRHGWKDTTSVGRDDHARRSARRPRRNGRRWDG